MRKLVPILIVLISSLCVGCNDDGVGSDEEARQAYLGLDESIEKSIALGFQGFNMADSANIAPQTTTGIVAGTLTVTGQVDQGSSDNKGMRLNIALVDYDDGDIVINENGVRISLVYDTDPIAANQPYMQIMLKSIPSGTFDGYINSNASTLGVYHMMGDLEGTLILNVTFTGTLMPCLTVHHAARGWRNARHRHRHERRRRRLQHRPDDREHAGIRDPGWVERVLDRRERGAERWRALAVVPRAMQTTHCVMMRDRAARARERFTRCRFDHAPLRGLIARSADERVCRRRSVGIRA